MAGRALIFGSLIVFAVFGCKKAGSDSAGSGAWPERVSSGGEGDATVANKIGTIGADGGKSVSVDLERPARPGEGGMWTCWSALPDDFALGRAVCSSDAKIVKEITAANVDKTCGNNVDFGTVKAKTPLDFGDCATYEVFVYEFEPTLMIKIVE